MSEQTLGKARGLNSIADPSEFKGRRGRKDRRVADEVTPAPPRVEDRVTVEAEPEPVKAAAPVTPHRAVVPGVQRKRRELSIPVPVAEALESTGINAADVVKSAYRTHSDAIFSGAGGRLVSRGRQRLRLSISDVEFDKLTRLGEARGWNRSETVAVLLTLELLTAPEPVNEA